MAVLIRPVFKDRSNILLLFSFFVTTANPSLSASQTLFVQMRLGHLNQLVTDPFAG